jgi:hypothetical protein
MVLVKHDTVVVLATSVTAASWVLPVLADAAMTCADMTALLAVLPQPCTQQERHGGSAGHHRLRLLLSAWSAASCTLGVCFQLYVAALLTPQGAARLHRSGCLLPRRQTHGSSWLPLTVPG